MAKETIMVVDDEEHILELIRFNLENAGFRVITVDNGEDALVRCNEGLPSLMLLDIMLPGMDGLEVCKRLKSGTKTKGLPIIMLTAKGEEIDKILGLELGADDYITKPFSVRELTARVKALLRRASSAAAPENSGKTMHIGRLTIDTSNYEAFMDGLKLELTLKEFELLKILVQNKGKVMTRDFLLDQVWGYEYIGETRTVDVHIRHLRQKLGDEQGGCIETIRGVGYKYSQRGEH